MILSIVAVLMALTAQGLGSKGPVSIDIVGSEANNTTILAEYGDQIDLDVVGSTASNIQIGYPAQKATKAHMCDACGREKCYETPWDDFKRPLCYPWSSYIPTRYNRLFYTPDRGCHDGTPGVLTLGRMTANP